MTTPHPNWNCRVVIVRAYPCGRPLVLVKPYLSKNLTLRLFPSYTLEVAISYWNPVWGGRQPCTYTIEQTCSDTIQCVHEALIKRGGGKRPDEARQPACIVRKGANSGGIFRKMRGICNKAKTPAYRGFFVSWIFL